MRYSQLTVGVFVSVALALFVSITIWLSGRGGNEPVASYSMFFYKDVSGLMLGGPVFYLGVEVGSVTHMQIIPGDPMSIRVDIRVLDSTPIDTGTSASLMFQGITGVAVINLAGDPGMNLPLKTPPGQDFPVIEVRDAGLAALLSGAPGIMTKMNRLLDQANELMGSDNRVLINDTLHNIESMTRTLQQQEEAFAALPESLNSTLADMREILSQLSATAGDMRPALAATVQNIEQMSARLASLTTRLDQWAGDNSADMEDFLNNGLGQVAELVSDARDALREMEKLLQELRDNPSRLVYKPVDNAVNLE